MVFGKFFRRSQPTSPPPPPEPPRDADYLAAVAVMEALQEHKRGSHPLMKLVGEEAMLSRESFNRDGSIVLDSMIEEMMDKYKEAGLDTGELEARLRAEIANVPKPPSRFEHPINYAIIAKIADTAEAILRGKNMPIAKRPIFGTLQTGRLNGMAVRIKNDKYYLIFIEDGLFGFANLFSKCIAQAFPPKDGREGETTFSTDDDDVTLNIVSNDELLERFFDVIQAYVVAGYPHAARPYIPHPRYAGLASILTDTMEHFIIGHEYGHCVLGHLEDGSPQKAAFGDGQEVDLLSLPWKQELEADYMGFMVAMEAMDRQNLHFSLYYCGMEALFATMTVVERAVSILRFGEVREQVLDSHPPSDIRRMGLRMHLEKAVGEEGSAGAVELANKVTAIIEMMWVLTEPRFQEMREQGVQPHENWLH